MPMPEGLNKREHLTSRHRLRGFNYATPGYYFVTFCTYQHQPLYGSVRNGKIMASSAGVALGEIIASVSDRFASLAVESFVVMPNHVHLLLYLDLENEANTPSDVVKWIKGAAAAKVRDGVRNLGWPPFHDKVWKDGFHDEIVRNDHHLENVRRYIAENPERWIDDEFYPP